MPDIGQVAYEAYRAHSDGKSLVSGAPIPQWHDLNGEIQEAWRAAAGAVADIYTGVEGTAD